MDLKLIEKFIELAKNSGVSELEYESKKTGDKISVSFPYAGSSLAQQMPMLANNGPVVTGKVENVENKLPAHSGLKEITSPFVGTFYKSPSPDAEPYVSVGKRISDGQVLCIIEAMKIMNEIESDISGEVVEVCVENETYVEFGQVLFRVKP